MGQFDLVIETTTAAQRESFLMELDRSTQLHGESYDVVEKEGVFQLNMRPNAPMDGSFSRVFMDICDWKTLWKEPSRQSGLQEGSARQFGVYRSPEGELWIDGSWQNAYGRYEVQDRNARVEAAQKAFPKAKIHASPHVIREWRLVA